MKIIRYQDNAGRIAHASLQENGTALEITGDIFGDHQVTQRPAQVAKLLAPIVPSAILCIGLNYKHHAAESNAKIPEFPILFYKGRGTLQNPGDPIELPTKLRSDKVDYECELAVVIGYECKNVPRSEAMNYVLGYTIANDVSARDWQKQWGGSQWCRGKTFDTFCPLGPAMVTPSAIKNPNNLALRTRVNGVTLQESNTRDMIFPVDELIEFLSGSTTLEPGTVILTGTPEGVGMGRKPPVYLKPGDVVEVEIEGIGVLSNPVIEEELSPMI